MKMKYGKILNIEYANGTSLKNIAVDTAPLVVLSFGKNIGNAADFELVNRTEGRKDYQLLFIAEGQMIFTFGGRDVTYGPNTMVLFKPGEPQIYRVSPECDNAVRLFIHFSGSEVEKYLARYGIDRQVYSFVKPFSWFEQIFNEMDANHLCVFQEDISNSLLATLLAIIGSTLRMSQPLGDNKFSALTHMMRENCTKNYPISKYAEYLGYSEIHFIAYFKKQLKKTPHQYIVGHRMQIAKQLLLTTNEPVKSIAVQVGYPNSRYFSRVFFKHFRKTPTEFRQRNRFDIKK